VLRRSALMTRPCRITIDGVVKDERSVNTVNADTFCLDKSG
jgi:MmpS family membrane protein